MNVVALRAAQEPTPQTALPQLVRISKAAAILDVSASTVRNLVNAGQLRAVRLSESKGSAIRISLAELERFIAERSGAPAP